MSEIMQNVEKLMLSLLILVALCRRAEAQTPTAQPTVTPMPTATATPMQAPNPIDDFRGTAVKFYVGEPVEPLRTTYYWLLDATLETNLDSPKSFPFVRVQSSGAKEVPGLFAKWLSLKIFPSNFAVISATLEFTSVADIADNTRVFVFPFKDQGVAGATLSPME